MKPSSLWSGSQSPGHITVVAVPGGTDLSMALLEPARSPGSASHLGQLLPALPQINSVWVTIFLFSIL